ncbi:MAG: 16S rRNA (cytosine(1402)-N(4))-methyltransferase RsmH [Bifidobacteriaceae bacterium]|jgi:16S rRNA (cytosine1402-N4)-methyltransferase|nr:16S rRNA (cytosine(1402)-N(4))-methyltransferase RsmH [Bifidobacteriaceae bacterium]
MDHGTTGHLPVSPERFLELVSPALAREGAVYVDATIGLGGHALAVAEAFGEVRIIGLDRDPAAVEAARRRLADHTSRATVVHANYDQLAAVCGGLGVLAADAVLFDLGVSSPQLDQDERGFAYSRDTALDMRMDTTQELTAAQVLASYPQAELAAILRRYGEERYAGRIAAAIVEARATRPIERSSQLVDLIRTAIPAPARRTGGNPAKRTFQALRVEVNGELAALEAALPQAIDLLRVGGRVVVMSYQSLEDAIVKRVLQAGATSRAPAGLPVEPAHLRPVLRLVTRGAEHAPAAEQARNPRSAPLRLRAAEKVRVA